MKPLKSFILFAKLMLVALLGIIAGAFFTSLLLTAGYNVPVTATVLIIGSISVLASFIPKHQGTLQAVTVEIWQDWIAANVFKTSDFISRAQNADQYVYGGSVVHIPQAGAKPRVVKNRTQFPAVSVYRGDTDVTYALDIYTTDPTVIPQAEKYEISYDKMASVFGDHLEGIREQLADELLYKWRPESAAAFVPTGGAAASATAPGATGNRKIVTVKDIRKLQTALNKQKASKTNRNLLLPSEMLGQLQDDPELKLRDVAKELDMRSGVIASLYGFDILERTETLIADMSGSPVVKAIGAVAAVTDSEVALAWTNDAVERAVGTIEFFDNERDAFYYGDVYDALVKAGGRKRRTDGVGIVGLYQATA